MKKLLPIVFFSVFIFASVAVSAQVIGGTYLTVSSSELGTITIYIDDTYKESFGLNNDLPVLLRGSSITGYTLTSAGVQQYRITIASFGGTWQYRLVSGTSTTHDLTITGYDRDSSNIVVDGVNFSTEKLVPYLIVFFGILIILVLWRR